jgi:hypothetical protein
MDAFLALSAVGVMFVGVGILFKGVWGLECLGPYDR